MAWGEKTWVGGELVTHTMMNTYVRPDLLLLKTNIDDDGSLRTGLKSFAYSSGQGNGAGSVDTELTSYRVTVPANFLADPGNALILEGTWLTSAQAGTKLAKLQLGSGTLVTILSTTAVSTRFIMSLILRGRTGSTGSVTGTILGSTAHLAALTVSLYVNVGMPSMPNTTEQLLKWFANAAVAGELTLHDLSVIAARGVDGVLV